MLVILFEYFFHQPYLHVFFFLKPFYSCMEFLYITKLCIAMTKSFLHVQVGVIML